MRIKSIFEEGIRNFVTRMPIGGARADLIIFEAGRRIFCTKKCAKSCFLETLLLIMPRVRPLGISRFLSWPYK